ncbi:alcohol dehydrogenase [Rhizobium anhuiense]|uniref:quinone oxidoreductase family protein n=1 Tax=Rhizobium anhuiense TaxID=1184720 RepID=UPI000BE9A01E|nr:zinc-binding alcohol dehydrogenase family protein [Rhizobium anhuiense]PDS63032.1 alcohol dehydrogenase [Rhizobium anhuiense]
MRAAVVDNGGAPEALRIVSLPEPRPGPADVLIRVEAISLEGGDLADRQQGRTSYPAVMGYAAAGKIIEVGRDVEKFRAGQRVATFAFSGSHADLRVAPAATTFAVPDGVDIGVAAAIPCGPGTAALALSLGRLQPGETVLITGAAGGVGSAAIQIAAAKGARVVGAARSLAHLQTLKDLGLSDLVTIGDSPVEGQVRSITGGRGADLLIDTIGGHVLLDGLSSLTDGGRAVMVGVIGGFNTPIDTGLLFEHRLTVTGCFMGPVMSDAGPRALIEALLQDCADGRFTVPIDARFALADIVAAHRQAEKRGRLGRVIVMPV